MVIDGYQYGYTPAISQSYGQSPNSMDVCSWENHDECCIDCHLPSAKLT